ncbi:hypothetical protein, partial [Acinetobacter baumannii]|uniref:hypothetical protein n=1 Tax=Acinetobacter baumannii TaxID=470 RepID=UPI001C087EB5
DHSNMAEVVAVLRDPLRVADIVANCYAEVAENPAYSYDRFIETFDDVVEGGMAQRQKSKTPSFSQTAF